MKPKRCFLDSGVLIAAVRGTHEISLKALDILGDPNREFASSIFVKLETLPKAAYNRKQGEIQFYNTYFEAVNLWADNFEGIASEALRYAESFGLGAMDALHVAAALSVGADELITIEKPDKPIHRVKNIKIITLFNQG